MLNYNALSKANVETAPFPYMAASDVVDEAVLEQISADFPAITSAGVFPLSELDYGGAFKRLIEAIQGRDLEELLEEKFNMVLRDNPLMITVRGQCQKKDGRIHTDSKDKILTCLLYLNDRAWNEDGGRLRLLRDGRDMNSVIVEIPPQGGNFVAFKRTDNSWHGHAPFVGRRRYIMFNWLQSDAAFVKNIGRHRLSAFFKRMGIFDGY
ncbi:MAG: 2OG-Fe(II) oxygenase [Alphaproteobacteria bacterium]